MARDSELHIGQWVNKVGGRYGGPGRIVGDTMALDDDGYKLWNVEHRIEGGYGKFCHVYPSSVLEVAGRDPVIETRNDNAGYVEFVNYDGPFVVRDLPAPSAVLLDMKTRRIIGYRVYDPSPAPSTNAELSDYADRMFNLHGFMLREEYRGKPAVTITFPDDKEANQFHRALCELSQHRSDRKPDRAALATTEGRNDG